MATKLTNVISVVDALGGIAMVANMLRVSQPAVWNWRVRGRFPAVTYVVLQRELAALNLQASDSLWSMRTLLGRPRRPPARTTGSATG